MCFLITADGFRPLLLHRNNPKQNNLKWAGVKLSLIADWGTASWSALFFFLFSFGVSSHCDRRSGWSRELIVELPVIVLKSKEKTAKLFRTLKLKLSVESSNNCWINEEQQWHSEMKGIQEGKHRK